jgi:hypothetical protein
MLLSLEKRKNRPVLSISLTFTYYLLPVTYYPIAASDSRLCREDDRKFGRNLTIAASFLHLLTIINGSRVGTLFAAPVLSARTILAGGFFLEETFRSHSSLITKFLVIIYFLTL